MDEAATWAAAAMGAVTVYRMRWWHDVPQSRLFTMAFGALSGAFFLAVSPVVERVNHLSINLTGHAIVLPASTLLASVAFSAYTAVALRILTGSGYLGRYIGAAWSAAAAILVGSWIAGDARYYVTPSLFTARDVPANIFATTYAVLMTVTALATLFATYRALQHREVPDRLRRAIGGLFVAALCTIGLSVTLLLNALVLQLPLEDTRLIEHSWWVPITIALVIAGW